MLLSPKARLWTGTIARRSAAAKNGLMSCGWYFSLDRSVVDWMGRARARQAGRGPCCITLSKEYAAASTTDEQFLQILEIERQRQQPGSMFGAHTLPAHWLPIWRLKTRDTRPCQIDSNTRFTAISPNNELVPRCTTRSAAHRTNGLQGQKCYSIFPSTAFCCFLLSRPIT
jgi:hypothetical protein